MAKSNYSNLKVVSDGPLVAITIDREKVLNALNSSVIEELGEAIDNAVDPDNTRVVTIEGAGDKAFVAGADISEMVEMDPNQAIEFARLGQTLSQVMESLPQIFVAKVKGFALGGGCELAMACDIIVAGRSAKFGQPEVNLGLIPGFGGTQRLVRRIGLPKALDMLVSGRGRMMAAEEAYQAGLISRLVDDDQVDAETAKLVEGIVNCGPEACSEAKRLARQSYQMSLEAGLQAEASAFGNCFVRHEAEEGMSAFLQKRSPNFR